jgi:hypothetical protein
MTGRHVWRDVARPWGIPRVLLMSGLEQAALANEGERLPFLAKPFSQLELLVAVRRVLADAASTRPAASERAS